MFCKKKIVNNELKHCIEASSYIDVNSVMQLGSYFDFSIFEVIYNEDINIFSDDIIEVSENLNGLLCSAKQYPIAIAFTNESIRYYAKKFNIFSLTFTQILCERILEHYLNNQRKYPFFLARFKSEVITSELLPNYYYWIVGYDEEKNHLIWLSYDNNMYYYALDGFEFDIKPHLLKRLKGYPKKALSKKINTVESLLNYLN